MEESFSEEQECKYMNTATPYSFTCTPLPSLTPTTLLSVQPPAIPLEVTSGERLGSGCLPTREQLSSSLTQFINSSLLAWTVDIEEFCAHNHRQLLELKVHCTWISTVKSLAAYTTHKREIW